MSKRCRKETVAAAETTAIGAESRTSSEMQFGSLTNTAFGAVSAPAATVAHGFEVAQSVTVVAVQPIGRAGAVTVSNASEHGVGPVPAGTSSSPVQVTTVVPTGKVEPEGGMQTTLMQLDAVGAG